jgi:hypothetical protein
MGAADDLKKGLTKNLANFTKQRKAEEKHSGAVRWRQSRMREVRGAYLVEVVKGIMTEAYMKVSDNNKLTANARQIFYVVRPLVEQQADKPLHYGYFSQVLLPNYINEHAHAADWDVAYDDRGHFVEPHTNRVIGLGTINVRKYLSKVGQLKLERADFASASVETYGPHGNFGAVLYIEKEGFMSLFERVNLAKRYDIAIMSSKGMSVTAARELADGICGVYRIPLLVLHDFDSAGIVIKDTLEHGTRRYRYRGAPTVIDLGLHYDDIGGFVAEPNNSNISDQRLREAGLDEAAVDFLRTERVELNAMTSRQFVNFVEAKLKQHQIRKVIPDRETLSDTYKMFVASDRLRETFDNMKDRLEADSEVAVSVPDDLESMVREQLDGRPEITWHRAVWSIVDPGHEDDNDGDGEADHEDDDDEDLSDIDE